MSDIIDKLLMQNLFKAIATRIPLLSIILSAVVAWFLIPITHGFPMVPFFVLFTGLSTLVYAVRHDKNWSDATLYVGILILSSFLLVRSNEVVQFITLLSIILAGSLLILPVARSYSLANFIFTPIFMFLEAIMGKNMYPYSWEKLKRYNTDTSLKVILPSILVTVVFLAITIPLLSSANPFFKEFMDNILSVLNLQELASYFEREQIFFYIVRIGILIFFAFAIPRVLTLSKKGVEINKADMYIPINYLFPKIAMGILLSIFLVMQAKLYFASAAALQSIGYTNSRLTNEVFFQVTVVAFIIFFLAYLDRERKKSNKIMTYILILQAFFLVGIAFKSVFDYTHLWGLTQKRLWGYATMTWLTGVLSFFTYYYKKQMPLQRFFQLVICYTIVIIVGINSANFDYLISHYSKARTQAGTDYVYQAKLSADASSYKQTLNELISEVESSGVKEEEKINATHRILSKILFLQQKYKDKTFQNSFNFSEYNEFLRVKDVNTEAYRSRIFGVEQKFTQKENPTPTQIPKK